MTDSRNVSASVNRYRPNRAIVRESAPVLLVGGGEAEPALLEELLNLAPLAVAADGEGARALLGVGKMPIAVIGDMDSLDPELADTLGEGRLWRIPEQDTVDFEKCLSRIEAPLVYAAGFSGGRMDHALAVLNVLARRVGPPVVLAGPEDAATVLPEGEVTLDLPVGSRLSLMPLGPARVTSRGLRWELDGAELRPDAAVSPSNEVESSPVVLEISGPVLAVTPPEGRSALAAAATSGARAG